VGAQHELTDSAARGLLARGQRLTDAERSDGAAVAEVVRAVVGLQAQDRGAGALGVRARLADVRLSEVQAALEDRSIVRLWCMRGTLHYVAADDAGWLGALLGPMSRARSRKRMEAMGVAGDDAVDVVRDVLASATEPMTRREIAAAARERGFALADDPQAPAHLLARAVAAGEVVETGFRGGKPVYLLWRDWLPDVPVDRSDRDALLAELARRHLRAHAPAGPEDLATWSGLGRPDARRAYELIAGELEPVLAVGRDAFVVRGTQLEAEPADVRLLPMWDGLLLGHRDRLLTVPEDVPKKAIANAGILNPTILVDGLVRGLWKLDRGRPALMPFEPLPSEVGKAVHREAADVSRFRAG
jgi:hypothetical protein